MAIWSTAGSIISCELPEERNKKKKNSGLSFSLCNYRSKRGDRNIHVIRHECRQMQGHGWGVLVPSSTCTCAVIRHLWTWPEASQAARLSGCLLCEATFHCHDGDERHHSRKTDRMSVLCFDLKGLPGFLSPVQMWDSCVAAQQMDVQRRTLEVVVINLLVQKAGGGRCRTQQWSAATVPNTW